MKWLEDNYWWNYFFNFEMYCEACGRLTSLSVETHMTTAFEITETTSTWKQIYFFLLMENQGRNNNPNYQHTFTLFFLSNERHNLCLLLIILFFFFSFLWYVLYNGHAFSFTSFVLFLDRRMLIVSLCYPVVLVSWLFTCFFVK